AFTARDQKAVRAAAQTMRANPEFDTEKAITELGVGEALVSFLDEKGRPGVVERAFVAPPASRIGPISDEERARCIRTSNVAGIYDRTVDRESAYEKLQQRAASQVPDASSAGSAAPAGADASSGGLGGIFRDALGGVLVGSGRKDSAIEAMTKSAARSIGSTIGREIVRGVLGTLLGGGTARRRR